MPTLVERGIPMDVWCILTAFTYVDIVWRHVEVPGCVPPFEQEQYLQIIAFEPAQEVADGKGESIIALKEPILIQDSVHVDLGSQYRAFDCI